MANVSGSFRNPQGHGTPGTVSFPYELPISLANCYGSGMGRVWGTGNTKIDFQKRMKMKMNETGYLNNEQK